MLPPKKSAPFVDGWESERETEQAKVPVRWFAVFVLFCAVEWMRYRVPDLGHQISGNTVLFLVASAVLMTALEAWFLWRPSTTSIPRYWKYITVFGDIGFISALVYYTGFTQSPFFFVYFVFLISNCLRYGLWMSLFVAGAVNLCYVMVLGFAPPGAVKPTTLGGEGLKLLSFWVVAFYGGTISARLRRQANQLRVYEETIADLQAQVESTHQPTEPEVGV